MKRLWNDKMKEELKKPGISKGGICMTWDFENHYFSIVAVFFSSFLLLSLDYFFFFISHTDILHLLMRSLRDFDYLLQNAVVFLKTVLSIHSVSYQQFIVRRDSGGVWMSFFGVFIVTPFLVDFCSFVFWKVLFFFQLDC